MRFKKHAIALTLAALLAGHSSAALLVYDPWNHAENIITAIHQIKSLIELVKHTSQLGDANMSRGDYSNTFGGGPEMEEFLGILSQTQIALKEGKKAFDDIQNVFGASKYDNWESFASGIAQRKESGDKQAMQLFDAAFAADKQIRHAYDANKKILQGAKNVSGVTSAVQSVANLLSLTIDQNNTMLLSMSTKNKLDAQRMEKEALEKEQVEKEQKRYRDESQKAYDKDLSKLRGMGVKIE